MKSLAVIIARAGSKGLPGKNASLLAGKPMVQYSIDLARASRRLDRLVVSTDCPGVTQAAKALGAEVFGRPPELASDTATVDAAVRNALSQAEQAHQATYDAVVVLYCNVPIRPADLVNRALEKLQATGCDSVQSVCPVGKMHPYWMKKLGGAAGDSLLMYEDNAVYRRQELPPVYMLDGGIIAVTRASLMKIVPGQPHAFLGSDRRAVVTQEGEVVDIDTPADLQLAELVLKQRLAHGQGAA